MMNFHKNLSAIIHTPIGILGVVLKKTSIGEILFLDDENENLSEKISDEPIIQKAHQQLIEYFSHGRKVFDLPLQFEGTFFQQRVWNALREIPFGATQCYNDIAQKLQTSARAVGNACRVNPFPIIIPCHRVIARNGLGGYSGETDGKNMAIKTWLLQHESQKI